MLREQNMAKTFALSSERSVALPHLLKFSEVRIENTNRCGYRCFFCPRDEQTRLQGTMPLADLELVLDKVGPHEGLVDLHGFGEPLLDRELIDKIKLVKARWPLAEPRFYSTLGVKVGVDFFHDLVAAGLRHMEVSFYGFDRASYREAHGADRYQIARENLIRLCAAEQASQERLKVIVRAFPQHVKIKQPGATVARQREFQDWIASLGITVLRERDLHNYGRGREYNTAGESRPCSVVWGFRRRALQITWDLFVIPCCFDFNAEMKLGNLRTQSLDEIFLGQEYQKFIQSHIDDRLENYPVCQHCERCYRP
jgi:radical SAM protein with 4Fe4S-binding SPASM domain